MVILGIDYGLSRIGLALADNALVQPLGVIQRSPRLVRQLQAICQKNNIERIIIGLPEGKIATEVKKFAHQLKLAVNLPINFQDESLTTQEAFSKMIMLGKKRKARQKKQDSFAAALILQAYLERKKYV